MISVVTGATGCLGLNLTRRLIKEGHAVIALGRNLQLGEIISQMGATFVPLDLKDLESLSLISQNADFIFHCAALSSPWGKYKDFYQANVIGTHNVVQATPSQARLVYVSTPSIYFDFTEKHNIKENALLPAKPVNYYVQTKLIAESIVDKAQLQRGLDVITIRPRGIFGPYDRAIFPRLLKAERQGVLPIIGSGNHLIDITFVENVVESLILAALADKCYSGKKYNITNDEPRTFIDIISRMFSALNKPLKTRSIPYNQARFAAKFLEFLHRVLYLKTEPKITEYGVGVLAFGQTLNIEEAKKDLKYKPIYSIDEGIMKFAEWYCS
ncbi:TPA: NAD-dependent epimerase/dehydratase family protein [Legionella pneumophila]|nr:NAD-dependent epimerase/dehydratase family protein [Legionella pneumophila]HAT2058900.1 NAD-dependent epimerase/dehydratase family protein [Legionella pneumophila]HBB6896719.1 NAD-dependent epimerase/dehydratase family protein [Legionella pneumophila]HBB6898951.1 NAD-dependent epimerase/dehydratase family protein [Legionella pneumophila]